jgi:hypothetical protein
VEGWQPVPVPSSSTDQSYTVLVNPWGLAEENICECKGYGFRGTCRHQKEALDRLCAWVEGDADHQTTHERTQMICPKCGGRTRWTMEVSNE